MHWHLSIFSSTSVLYPLPQHNCLQLSGPSVVTLHFLKDNQIFSNFQNALVLLTVLQFQSYPVSYLWYNSRAISTGTEAVHPLFFFQSFLQYNFLILLSRSYTVLVTVALYRLEAVNLSSTFLYCKIQILHDICIGFSDFLLQPKNFTKNLHLIFNFFSLLFCRHDYCAS